MKRRLFLSAGATVIGAPTIVSAASLMHLYVPRPLTDSLIIPIPSFPDDKVIAFAEYLRKLQENIIKKIGMPAEMFERIHQQESRFWRAGHRPTPTYRHTLNFHKESIS